MTQDNNRSIVPSEEDSGFINNLMQQLKLVWRLFVDSRVNFLLKLLPIGALVYLIFPFDIPGPFDDATVLGVGFYLFVELCPTDVVEEHRAELKGGKPKDGGKSEDVINAEFDQPE